MNAFLLCEGFQSRSEERAAIGCFAVSTLVGRDLNSCSYFLVGECCQKLGLLNTAIQSYLKSAEMDPALYMNHVKLWEVYLQLGRTQKALEAYREAVRLNPEYVDERAFRITGMQGVQ